MRILNSLRYRFGFNAEVLSLPSDISASDREILNRVRPYTMTSIERLLSLIAAVRHVVRVSVPGDIVECGVWKGGSMMAAALTLIECGETRGLHLYDTFEGMPQPSDYDRSKDGAAADQLASTPRGEGVWCRSPLDEVRRNVESTGYLGSVRYVKGMVEETIPDSDLPRLAVLRLDTDWYTSTKHELEHLFPLLNPGGILIIDDYGWWEGARKAVDEWLIEHPYFLHRIDETGRLIVKDRSRP